VSSLFTKWWHQNKRTQSKSNPETFVVICMDCIKLLSASFSISSRTSLCTRPFVKLVVMCTDKCLWIWFWLCSLEQKKNTRQGLTYKTYRNEFILSYTGDNNILRYLFYLLYFSIEMRNIALLCSLNFCFYCVRLFWCHHFVNNELTVYRVRRNFPNVTTSLTQL
jgi:hypothetical protein